MDTLLAVQGLRLDIGSGAATRAILKQVNLTIRSGETHGLIGQSGGGKTMVGRTIMGLQPETAKITGGRVLFEGRDLLTVAASERRSLLGRSISMVLQQPMSALNPAFSIGAQMADFLRVRLGVARAETNHRAIELLESVKIREPERVLRQYPHELSGGMCQRVAIALAFAGRPKLVIADEPTTALDVTVQLEILRLMRRLQRDFGAAFLFITHDIGVVAKICDSVSVISDGEIVESGAVEEVLERPRHPYTEKLMLEARSLDVTSNADASSVKRVKGSPNA